MSDFRSMEVISCCDKHSCGLFCQHNTLFTTNIFVGGFETRKKIFFWRFNFGENKGGKRCCLGFCHYEISGEVQLSFRCEREKNRISICVTHKRYLNVYVYVHVYVNGTLGLMGYLRIFLQISHLGWGVFSSKQKSDAQTCFQKRFKQACPP